MNTLLPILKAIADETRLSLLQLLLTQDLCGKALAGRLGITEAAVSQHLKILREAGLIRGEKRGYWTHYGVEKQRFNALIGQLECLARPSPQPPEQCLRIQPRQRNLTGKEIKTMCCEPCCCQQPEKLKDKPETCTPEQSRQCHGDIKDHPCQGQQKPDP